VEAIAGNIAHSCALTSAGRVRCWGLNDHGQLGDGTRTDRSTPVAVESLSGVASIAVGSFHTCALMSSGAVRCWGSNDAGQLGDGTTTDRSRPVAVTGFGPAVATLAVLSRSVAVTPARIASVKLHCGPQARCGGNLELTAARTTLGSRAFSLPAGVVQAVPVKLTPRGFKKLERAKRLSTQVTVTGATAASRTITLVAPS
jgi:hypothetical protein